MKFRPAIKIDKRNTKTLRNFDHGIMSANCDVVAIFPINGQFGETQKLDSKAWSAIH